MTTSELESIVLRAEEDERLYQTGCKAVFLACVFCLGFVLGLVAP
jgi:hypothetical protein